MYKNMVMVIYIVKDIYHVGGSIYTAGFRSMYSSTIQNVNNSLMVFGYEALANSIIANVYDL